MSDLKTNYEIEKESLQKLFETNPELLKRRTFIEDYEYLKSIGVFIPNKDILKNEAFIKLWTEDFVVEEITQNNHLVSIFETQIEDLKDTNSNGFSATLIKNNIGTPEAVRDLSRKLGLKDFEIQYAGIKDNDALTAQKITIQNASFNQLKNIVSENYYLTNIKQSRSKLKIGELKGNNFTLLARTDPEKTNVERIASEIESLNKNGFYNFYYSQRFGTLGRDNNHKLGLLVAQEKYEEALFLYLTDAPKSGFEFTFAIYKDIKNHFGDWNYIEKITSQYPIIFEKELLIVRFLKKNPEDILGALSVNKGDIKFWILGLASWLFNIKLSNYLKSEKTLPEKIDLITSTKVDAVSEYKEELKEIGLDDFNVEHLLDFDIQKAVHPIDTIKQVEFKKVFSTPYGLILQFTLDKGSYATTVLAHFLNLIIGEIPKNYSVKRFDCLKSIAGKSIVEIINKFKEK